MAREETFGDGDDDDDVDGYVDGLQAQQPQTDRTW
jgi:hypothetical protein